MKTCPYCGRMKDETLSFSPSYAGMCRHCAELVQQLAEDLARTTQATFEEAVPVVRAGLCHMRVLVEKNHAVPSDVPPAGE